MRKMYQWRLIEDIPKHVGKGYMVIYRYAPTVNEHHRDCSLPETYEITSIYGSRICSHFMIIDRLSEKTK